MAHFFISVRIGERVLDLIVFPLVDRSQKKVQEKMNSWSELQGVLFSPDIKVDASPASKSQPVYLQIIKEKLSTACLKITGVVGSSEKNGPDSLALLESLQALRELSSKKTTPSKFEERDKDIPQIN